MSGLPNLGNTCYINTILQCLRYQRHFVKLLKNYNTENDSKLHKFFVEMMFDGATDKHLRDFVFQLSVENKEFKLFKQCDAHELFLYLIDNFYDHHDMTNPFKGTIQSKLYCTCGYQSITKQHFISLSVSVKGSVAEMLDDYQKTEEVDVLCKCSKKLKKKMTIIQKPSNFVLHLNRFSNNNKKIKTQVKLDQPHNYKLTAICNHTGETKGGHYTSAVLKGHGGWQMCNDIHTLEIERLPEKSHLPYILFFERYKRRISDIK